jgi:dinuclear metal center YbgI/SA1388 family protein
MPPQTALKEIVEFCDHRVRRSEVKDFSGAQNGLQLENDGRVRCIGAAVDAGIAEIEAAVASKVDFLIVHHGLFWNPPIPLTGPAYRKISTAVSANLAIYGSHLPLDAHPEIGNNALLGKQLGLKPVGSFLPYEGTNIGLIAEPPPESPTAWKDLLKQHFPNHLAMEFGPSSPAQIAILTGSGASAVDKLPPGIDTLITGELRQHHYSFAQEHSLNLYCAGHWATEVFGVEALAKEVGEHFGLPWHFFPSACPL